MSAQRRLVEIFLGPTACSCSGMPSPAKLEKVDRALELRRFIEKEQQDAFQVKAWDLGDESMYEEGPRLLNNYLRGSGKTDLADRLAFAINDATPSIAVDGKIAWIRDCPEIADFMDRFGTAAKSNHS